MTMYYICTVTITFKKLLAKFSFYFDNNLQISLEAQPQTPVK